MTERECGESRKKNIGNTRLNPKYYLMGNQQPSPEQGKVQRLSRKGVGQQAIGCSKW